ncbi:putative lipase/esterase [Serinicoccus hydrothermalis]|uniref:Putative lipase/esterase n=1 Tax=Serinicoccus hydrothermalis TaxID=1758689 RepID=A0A1B1NEN0_9MICO|nr:alpha/beta hydrolase [Serinicoccus hydrothermalis]ANS79896.1 putative lipase/esterase [Serinicoccus hydrothermalis]
MHRPTTLDRRTLLALAGTGVLSACSGPVDAPDAPDASSGGPDDPTEQTGEENGMSTGGDEVTAGMERITYGEEESQWVERRVPTGPSRGTVVVLHGGFWRAAYGADLGTPLAEDLTAQGWTTLNVEYRRVGDGGGFPQTFDDVHAALELVDVDGPVVTLGHSAGGQLAAWAAGRLRTGQWSGDVEVTHVVSQAGVLDLGTAYEERLGGGAVEDFLAATPDDPLYDLVDPIRQVPLDAPLWALHAPDDGQVPISQSEAYVTAAREAGAKAEQIEVTGGHFNLIDVGTGAWAEVVRVLDSISSR